MRHALRFGGISLVRGEAARLEWVEALRLRRITTRPELSSNWKPAEPTAE